jgi:hypothetical protein
MLLLLTCATQLPLRTAATAALQHHVKRTAARLITTITNSLCFSLRVTVLYCVCIHQLYNAADDQEELFEPLSVYPTALDTAAAPRAPTDTPIQYTFQV